MIQLQAALTTADVAIKDSTMKTIVKYFNESHVQFSKGLVKVHRKTVFEILTYLIRVTPVLTGRLRGSWTPFLDRWGKQKFYARYLNDKSLARSKPTTVFGRAKAVVQGALGLTAVNEGKGLGYFADNGLVTTVGSNVVYAGKVNEYSQYLDRAVQQGVLISNHNFDEYIKAARAAGWIPPEDKVKDDPEWTGV